MERVGDSDDPSQGSDTVSGWTGPASACRAFQDHDERRAQGAHQFFMWVAQQIRQDGSCVDVVDVIVPCSDKRWALLAQRPDNLDAKHVECGSNKTVVALIKDCD